MDVCSNDFALKLANVNGTGSASANGLLMQAIFRMGIPVSGKNLFPSNIQGLPTWYEVRVNKSGHVARADITFLGVPFAKMCNEIFKESRERILMKNIAYLGALVALLDIDMHII